jgi:hypothetical protein
MRPQPKGRIMTGETRETLNSIAKQLRKVADLIESPTIEEKGLMHLSDALGSSSRTLELCAMLN